MIRAVVVDDDYRVAQIHTAYLAKIAGFAVIGQAHTAAAADARTSGPAPRRWCE